MRVEGIINVAEKLLLGVAAITRLTPEISEFVLCPAMGVVLPAAEAGAHIGVKTPGEAIRQYSLVHPNLKPASYTIAVKREQNGRGGSLAMHTIEVGSTLEIMPPVNDFSLSDAPGYLLIAGGIGVTPIYAMAQKLVEDGANVQVIYCVRNSETAAYLTPLHKLLGDRLLTHFDNGDPDKLFDFWDRFAEPGKEHVYCCGPSALMEEVNGVSGHWPDNSVHFEDFTGAKAILENDKAFEVLLRKSEKTLTVPKNKTILDTIRAAGVSTVSSCESGTCGTCKCGLVSGDVDHRDLVLMDDERSTHIMICVSRAASGGLVLDL